MPRPCINRWAMFYDECVDCGGDKIPHKGRGLCKRCHEKNYKRVKRERERFMECCEINGIRDWRGIRVYDNLLGEGTSKSVVPFAVDGEPHVMVAFDCKNSPIQWKTEELRRIA